MVETFSYNGTTYFNVPLENLIPGKRIDFPLSIYMPLNNNMVVLYAASRVLTSTDLEKYRKRGLRVLACPSDLHDRWLKYLETKNLTTQESLIADASEAFQKDDLSQDEKRAILSNVGERMIGLLSDIGSGDKEKQKKALEECRDVTDEIINVAMQTHKKLKVYEDLLMMRDGDIAHSSSVSAVAVIFALTLGFTDPEWLTDISMGALLHDLGHSSLSTELFDKPRLNFNEMEKDSYATHTSAGESVLQSAGEDVPPVVMQIISQHHERFDGKGFPSRLAGFQIDERVQIVSLADSVEELMSGQFTGNAMDPLEALIWIKDQHDVMDLSSVSPEIFEAIYQSVVKSMPPELMKNERAANE